MVKGSKMLKNVNDEMGKCFFFFQKQNLFLNETIL